MEDRKSQNKIKIETDIYYHEKNTQLTWGDIKHLQLEDNDKIISNWEDSEDGDRGYWYGAVTRMVEETDEQFQKRQNSIELEAVWAKQRRYESYLKLKKEFEGE